MRGETVVVKAAERGHCRRRWVPAAAMGSLTIEAAPGVGNLVVSDDADVSVFTVDEGVTATLVGLDLSTGEDGMGISNDGTLTVEDCNIYDNFGGDGGGIENFADGFMNVQNSTIADNYSLSGGGGIVNYVGTSTIESSTIFGNTADFGGGIDNVSGTTTLAATIVAGAPSGGECLGTVADGGYNVIDDGTCGSPPTLG